MFYHLANGRSGFELHIIQNVLSFKAMQTMLQMSAQSIFDVFFIKKIEKCGALEKGWQTCIFLFNILLVTQHGPR